MSTTCSLLLIAISAFCLPEASLGDSFINLEIDLETFINDGKDWKEQNCDVFTTTGCDFYFIICVDKPDGSLAGVLDDLQECEYYRNKSAIIHGAEKRLLFSDNIGGIPLPLKINITDWQGGFLLKVAVIDSDIDSLLPNPDDIFDVLEGRFDLGDPVENQTVAVRVDERMTGYGRVSGVKTSSLTVQYSSYCHPNYYHGNLTDFCQVHCADTDDDTGHFICDTNGQKSCLPGWEELENNCLNSTDDCLGNMCSTGSKCIDGLNNYTCKCSPGQHGRFCTETMTCADNPCGNVLYADCVTNSTGGYECICRGGKERPGCIVPGLDRNHNVIVPAGAQEDGTTINNNLPLIIGLICGLVLLLLIIILLIAILMSRRRRRRKQKDQATSAEVATSNAELQAGAQTSDTGTATFGNPLYMASNQAEPNHYAEVDYSRVKVPLHTHLPHDDYPIKSKAAEAGFVPEPEPLPVKRKIPAGAVPVYMNQAGHTPVYENQYTRGPGGASRGSPGMPRNGFSPMYSRHDMYGGNSGQFDNPTYDDTLEPNGQAAPNGKFDMRNKVPLYGYEEPVKVKQ